MLLAAPAEVLELLGIPTADGVLATATAALRTTAGRVEAHIESYLSASSWIDYFSVQKNFNNILRLSTGFVTEDSVVVSVSPSTSPISDSNEAVELDPAVYVIDYERGLITLVDTSSIQIGVKTIAVAYDAGFSADEEGVLTGLPDTLVQAGLLQAAKAMSLNPARVTKYAARLAPDLIRAYGIEAMANQNKHIRPRGDYSYPSSSVHENG